MLTIGSGSNPSVAGRRFAMRAGVMAGLVSVIAAGAAGFGAGSASASPDVSPDRVAQVQPGNPTPGPARVASFAADVPANPGAPCTPATPANCPPPPAALWPANLMPPPIVDNPSDNAGNPSNPNFSWAGG